jgi:hypothetical protein
MKTFIVCVLVWLCLASTTKGSEVRSYSWFYQDKNFSFSLTFPTSAQDDYKQETQQVFDECVKGNTNVKNGTDATSLLDVNFKLHISDLEKNEVVQQAVTAFNAMATDNNLNDNQLAELVITFVQKVINLDAMSTKAMQNADDNDLMVCGFVLSPAFTLYQGKGSVQDKSLLAFVLLEELGYNIFLKYFIWENEHGLPAVRHFGIFLIPTYNSADKTASNYGDIYAEVYYKNIPLSDRLKLTQDWQIVFKSTTEVSSPYDEADKDYRPVWDGVVLSAISCSRKNYNLNP